MRADRSARCVVVVALVATAALAVPGAARASSAGGSRTVPATDAARGLVYRDLRPAQAGGPCGLNRSMFEIVHDDKVLGCTHGPDTAPDRVDVRREVSTAAITGSAPAQPTAVPCSGDGTSGNRVRVIYAVAPDKPDRYSSVVTAIRQYAAEVNDVMMASAAETGGTRNVRWVTDGSCGLVVDHVVLPKSTDDDSFGNTITALKAKSYTDPHRKYLIFEDANLMCGVAEMYLDSKASSTNLNNGTADHGLFARVDTGCWNTLPTGHNSAAHELMHTLGAVQSDAPHKTSYGHCVDEFDTMCYADGSPSIRMTYPCYFQHEALMDCGHDDYFSTNPPTGSYLASHWNTAGSSFLDSTTGPWNDAFSKAASLAAAKGVAVGSNVSATKETGEPNTAGFTASRSVWWKIVPTSSQTLTVDTQQSSFDTVMGLYKGSSVSAVTLVASNDNAGSGRTWSRVAVAVSSGVAYYLKVDGKSGTSGAIRLHVGNRARAADRSVHLVWMLVRRFHDGRRLRQRGVHVA